MNEILPFGETWVPEPARRKISEWRTRPGLTADEHRLIDRLATHPDMRTRVWQKLPATARGAEGVIVEWAFMGARMAAGHRQPQAAKAKDLPDGVSKNPTNLTAETAAFYAAMLLEAMQATNVEARFWWASLWPGDPWITFEKVGALVGQVHALYQCLDQTGRQLTKALALPPARKGSEKAPERFFFRLLANLFTTQFGEPLTPIVAALTVVVFEKQESAGVSTARGRPRSAVRATPSRKKSK
jgi:hypothetical protein